MRKQFIPIVFFISLSFFLASCKDDAYLATAPPIPDQSFSEDFDSPGAATAAGWTFINASDPIGTGGWTGPSFTSVIPLYNGSGYAYSFNTVAQGSPTYAVESTISNWIVSKPLWLQNGDKIVFYTNSLTLDITPTALQVRMNKKNDGTNVGTGDDPGDFTELLLTVNPQQTVNAADSYPVTWTRFEAIVGGLSEPTKGRIAFRYYLPHNYQYNQPTTIVAIDRMSYISVKK